MTCQLPHFVSGSYWRGDTIANNTANPASGKGGGVYNGGSGAFTLTDGSIYDNLAYLGGGLYNGVGTMTLNDVTVETNTANQGGGMFLTASSKTTFNTVTVQANMLTGNLPKATGVGFQAGATMNNLAKLHDFDDPGGNPVLV